MCESVINIKHKSTMDIQPQFADIQQSTIDIQHDNLILAKPTLVENTIIYKNTGRGR